MNEIQQISIILKTLNNLINDSSIICDSEGLVKEIQQITCNKIIDNSKIAQYNFILFHSNNPPDLLNFLTETTTPQNINIKDLAKIRKYILCFIEKYIIKYKNLVNEHCLGILDVCFSVFKKEKDSSVKESSLKPIKHLIIEKLIDTSIFPISDIADWILRDLRIGKSSQTVNV